MTELSAGDRGKVFAIVRKSGGFVPGKRARESREKIDTDCCTSIVCASLHSPASMQQSLCSNVFGVSLEDRRTICLEQNTSYNSTTTVDVRLSLDDHCNSGGCYNYLCQ